MIPILETGLGRLFEADCLEFLTSIDGDTVDLAFADPPFIQASINPDRSRSLTLYGKPGTQYTVQYKTNLSNVVPWLPLLNTTLSNSFGTVAVPGTNPVVYYRLKKN